MNKITRMRGLHFLAGSALLMFASLSHAQYVWVDEKGVKQFSDRSPPANIPTKNILKAPRGQASATSDSAATPAPAAPGSGSVADREADYKKRQLAKADADKKTSSESAAANVKKAVCDTARAAKTELDSGVRLRNGTGNYMDDAERAQATANASKVLADCR